MTEKPEAEQIDTKDYVKFACTKFTMGERLADVTCAIRLTHLALCAMIPQTDMDKRFRESLFKYFETFYTMMDKDMRKMEELLVDEYKTTKMKGKCDESDTTETTESDESDDTTEDKEEEA